MTRHHGNFDLGQVLVTHNDFAIVDFERARRDDRPAGFDSPLRDVAALARSLSYVGGHALARALTRRPDDRALLEHGKARWSALARQRFLDCYDAAMRGRASAPPPAECKALLRLFELERILHDVRRQLGMRPDLLQVTLCSLLELLRRPGGRGSTRRDGA
jgi:maltose alpha-D-glucosyltransferase/alpha-amylase